MNALFSIFGKKGPPDGYRQASEGIHSDPNHATAAGGATGAGDEAGEGPGAATGKGASIVLGEIIAYRCWQTSAGLMQSLNGTIWYPDQPMTGEGIAFDNSSGVYAYKTLADAKKHARGYSGDVAIGSVKLWGTIIEHEDGYRAEYAAVDQIIDGPNINATWRKNSALVLAAVAREKATWAEVKDRHEDDRAGYKFRCERYGDFLSIFMERGGKKLASALSLIGVGAITPTDGEPPKLGDVRFWVHFHGDGPYIERMNGRRDRARMLHVPEPAATGGVQYMHFHDGRQDFTIQHCPMEAEDDQIYFYGTGVVVFAPHGLGGEVFEKILSATRAAYTPDASGLSLVRQ